MEACPLDGGIGRRHARAPRTQQRARHPEFRPSPRVQECRQRRERVVRRVAVHLVEPAAEVGVVAGHTGELMPPPAPDDRVLYVGENQVQVLLVSSERRGILCPAGGGTERAQRSEHRLRGDPSQSRRTGRARARSRAPTDWPFDAAVPAAAASRGGEGRTRPRTRRSAGCSRFMASSSGTRAAATASHVRHRGPDERPGDGYQNAGSEERGVVVIRHVGWVGLVSPHE